MKAGPLCGGPEANSTPQRWESSSRSTNLLVIPGRESTRRGADPALAHCSSAIHQSTCDVPLGLGHPAQSPHYSSPEDPTTDTTSSGGPPAPTRWVGAGPESDEWGTNVEVADNPYERGNAAKNASINSQVFRGNRIWSGVRRLRGAGAVEYGTSGDESESVKQ